MDIILIIVGILIGFISGYFVAKNGRSIQTVQKDYEDLISTRKRQLEKPLNQIEDLTKKKDLLD